MKLSKTIWNTWLLLLIIIITGVACHDDVNKRPPLVMKPSFSITDKNPLGLYVAHRLMQAAFSDLKMTNNNKSFYDYFYNSRYTEYNSTRNKDIFAIITKQFYPNEKDVYAMADFVREGNTLLVAANQFDWTFLEKFHLTTIDLPSLQEQIAYMDDMEETGIAMKDSNTLNSEPYHFFFYPLKGEVYRSDRFLSKIITVDTYNHLSSGTIFKYGSGRIMVVSNATALTNYFLLTKNNYQYLLHLLSYLPDHSENIIWDNYYNKKTTRENDDSFSSFQELMKYPAMRWAFWLTILGGILLIIMGLIRRQRVIPVLKPNINSSVEFAETVARLYLLKKDNKNIAAKMITYFLEHIRSKYYINTSVLNNEFVQLLAAKSGVAMEKAELLIKTIDQIQTQKTVSDHLLLNLNGQLQQFGK